MMRFADNTFRGRHALGSSEEDHICGRVIEETGKRACCPEELPGFGEPEPASIYFEEFENRYHGNKNTREEDCHFDDRMIGKGVFFSQSDVCEIDG